VIATGTSTDGIGKNTYWHTAAANDPGSYTWILSTAQIAEGVIAAYSGVDGTNPIDTSSGRVSSSGTAITAPSVQVAAANSMLVSLVGAAANVTISPPTGMTERAEVAGGTGTTKTVGEASDSKQTTAGQSGDKTATASRSAPAIAQLVVLRPAP
jgi:hypothetical protein